MTTTQDWLEARRVALGASEVPIILGQTTWGSPKEVQCRKLGLLPPGGDASSFLDWRKKLEAPMTDVFMEARAGWDCTRDAEIMASMLFGVGTVASAQAYKEAGETWCKSATFPWLGCSPDALCWKGEQICLLEFKTAYSRDDWSEGVPDYYLTQVHVQMLVTGLRKCFVVVSFGGGSEWPEIIEVDFDPDLAQDIARDSCEWWDRFVVAGEEVEITGSESERKTINALADRNAGASLSFEAGGSMKSITDRIHALEAEMEERKHHVDKLKNRIRSTMSDAGAQCMTFPGGDQWTYKPRKDGVMVLKWKEAK